MKKNRYLLCLLALWIHALFCSTETIIYQQMGLGGYFRLSWLLFALIVIAGNLTGYSV